MKLWKPLLTVIFLGSGFLYAQNRELLYDCTEIPQALLLNPGMETSFTWYAGIPLASGIYAQAGSSGITVNDLFANDGVDFNQKVRTRALNGMTKRDEFGATVQIDIFNGGFRSRSNPELFYSFGVYFETNTILYWPEDLAYLAFEGNADQLGRRFDLGHLKTRGEGLTVFHFGINKVIDRNLTVGARVKVYSGIYDFHSSTNSGYFLTEEGQNNLLSNTLVADMQLRTSGIEGIRAILDDEASGTVGGVLTKRALLGGDLGLGVDLGFTYHLDPQTVITGSLLDLGFVYHSGDVKGYSLQGRATTEGVEAILPDAFDDANSDFWQDLVDEIEAQLPFEDNNTSYLTFRPTQLYGSIRYNFGEPVNEDMDCDCDIGVTDADVRTPFRNATGLQLHAVNRPRGPQAALTAFYLRRFGNFLSLKGTYTVDKFSMSNLGLGMNLQAGPVNFYVLANNLLGYRNLADSRYASFQIGLNILSWGANR
ncbi:hypothetical protein SAMN06265375_102529 [Muriicola jejuensis]|uniref:DUF5723 domain-containing protein n=1 Tax=Muriicola jejuensis TaxID=504488 RepID=A0A6P0UJV3_9FLAO|nr:DUF5723 family protein [Muriicola jejuensis]NER10496.1 hypothetical protein [Muriicola jejuensis]SMP18497.1 hypothetical protein SAMN06265375_102529 [Muriicola jejuensis]